LSSRFARVRVRPAHRDYWLAESRPEEWLLIEWPAGEEAPTKYWLSTLPANVGFRQFVDIVKPRWRIERDYHELKRPWSLRGAKLAWLSSSRTTMHCRLRIFGLRARNDSSSEAASTKLFKEATIPETYRPRGSTIAA
jgi:hypothetical protein